MMKCCECGRDFPELACKRDGVMVYYCDKKECKTKGESLKQGEQ